MNAYILPHTVPHKQMKTSETPCDIGLFCMNKLHGIIDTGAIVIRMFTVIMGLLPDTQNCELRREYQERFPRHRLQRKRELVIPACFTARASCTCRDACRDR